MATKNSSSGGRGNDVSQTIITYHNISYAVPITQKRKTHFKTILEEVSGTLKPGLNAILGPSGSGKTSLIQVLAGRVDKNFLSGNVLVNEQRQQKNFRLTSGFVVQDDVICRTLTVRENLHFSAALRLGKKLNQDEQRARVEKIIIDLCLSECADTRIGTDEVRGVSGGERKRTCIGMELIKEPDVLFLDEPTTGLDATTALHIIQLLQQQAAQSRTIIFSIHQPRYSIFKLFDHVTLLSKGKLVFAGPRDQMLNYFDNIGYKCDLHNNPADHVLDVITTDQKRRSEEDFDGNDLLQKFNNSAIFENAYQDIERLVERIKLKNGDSPGSDKENHSTVPYPATWAQQFSVLSKRLLKNNFRDGRGVLVHYLVPIIISICCGALFYDAGFGVGGIQNRMGLCLLLICFMTYLNGQNGFVLFIEQRRLFCHEYASGYYRPSSYFLSAIACDMAPLRLLPALIFALGTYFLAGFQFEAGKFFIFLLTLMMTTAPATAIAIFAGNAIRDPGIAFQVLFMIYRLMLLFGGYVVSNENIPVWLRWLKYVSIFHYGQSIFAYNELSGMKFNECGRYGNESCELSGDEYLESQGYVGGVELIWENIGVLALLIAIFLVLAFVMLRRTKTFG